MTLLMFVLLSLFAGFAVPLQAGTNAKLGNLLGHPLWATAVSLLVSLVVLIVVIIVVKAPAQTYRRYRKVHGGFGWAVSRVCFTSPLLY